MYRGENRVKNYLTNSKFDLDAAFGIEQEELPHAIAETEPEDHEEEDVLKRYVPEEIPGPKIIETKYAMNEPQTNESIVTLAQSVLDLTIALKNA